MRARRLLAVLALGFSLAVWGAPPGDPPVAELAKDAEKLYSQGKYREAAELLKKVIEIAPAPQHYYDLAQALDKAGDLQASLECYEKYVGSPKTDPKLLKRANKSIERLRKQQIEEKAEQERLVAAELATEANKLSSQGKHPEAAELLKKAIGIQPSPQLYYDLALELKEAGDLPAALEYFKKYVASPKTKPKLLNRANESIEQLPQQIEKNRLEAEKEAERKRLEEEKRAAEAEAKRIEAERLASEQRQRAEAQRALDNWRLSRTLAFTSGGVAVAASGVGVLLGVHALDARKAYNEAGTHTEKAPLEAEVRQYALYADICFGVGLALATTAVVLFPKSPEPTYKVSLSVGPGSAALEVRF